MAKVQAFKFETLLDLLTELELVGKRLLDLWVGDGGAHFWSGWVREEWRLGFCRFVILIM
jgi:hypothetical protein